MIPTKYKMLKIVVPMQAGNPIQKTPILTKDIFVFETDQSKEDSSTRKIEKTCDHSEKFYKLYSSHLPRRYKGFFQPGNSLPKNPEEDCLINPFYLGKT